MSWLRALPVWLVLLVLAVINAGLREEFLVARFGRAPALVLGDMLMCGLVLVVTRMSIRWIGPRSARESWTIGVLWTVITTAFESGIGWFVQHKPITELLRMYTFADGNVWPLVLLTLLVAPRLFGPSEAPRS